MMQLAARTPTAHLILAFSLEEKELLLLLW
jgi:hypothetical protein